MDGRLQVRVLGPLELERAGRVLSLGSRLQRRLLAALAIVLGSTVSTDQLISLLWGEDAPPAARNSLQSHVARLRAALGDPGSIVTRPPGYALAPDRVEVDAARFEADVEQARHLLDGEPATAVTTLSVALARWRGGAYAEFADDLAHEEATRLAQVRIEARCLLAEAQLRAGDPPAAVAGFARLVAEEPLREDVARSAARALVAAGRTADALDVLQAFRVRLADELGLDPSGRLEELEQLILRGQLTPAADPVAASVTPPTSSAPSTDHPPPARPPRPRTPTVGRDADRARTAAALAEAPLVTLVGPGGVGKTRLASISAGAGAGAAPGDQQPAEVVWVDLARTAGDGDVLPAVLDALGTIGVDPSDRAATAAAMAHVRGVVVLDNCEHVLDAVAELVDTALAHGGPVRLLATSRERLDVAGEQVVAVGPLPVPSPGDATAADPAVQLFDQRLAAVGGGTVEPSVAARVAAAVDGLPLAIELAAARAATLPVDELLGRLSSHLDVLAGTERRHGDRQRTLTSVIEWSYDLLSDRDRAVFRRLSVFASAFGLSGAERVCAGDTAQEPDVADAIARLVERSMVVALSPGRYRLLEPLRLFAADELARDADVAIAERRHDDLMLDVATLVDGAYASREEADILAEVEAALPDLRAAHSRAVAYGDLEMVACLAGRLFRFAYGQGRFDVLSWGTSVADEEVIATLPEELRDDLAKARAACVTSAARRGRLEEAEDLAATFMEQLADERLSPWTRTILAETLGDLRLGCGRLPEARLAYGRMRELADRLGHDGVRSMAAAGLATAWAFESRTAEAVAHAREASELAARSGAASARSLAAYALGEALADDDPAAALAALDSAIAEASRIGARFYEGIARTADVALRGRHGDPVEALARYRGALEVWNDAGAEGLITTTLRNLVVLFARIGADEPALALASALERFATTDSFGSEARRLAGALEAVTERLGPDRVADARRVALGFGGLGEVARFGLQAIEDVR